jgi:hypothetical protein
VRFIRASANNRERSAPAVTALRAPLQFTPPFLLFTPICLLPGFRKNKIVQTIVTISAQKKSIMKKFLPYLLVFILKNAMAQGDPPHGFKKGSLQLADSCSLTGFVKEYMTNRASVVFRSDDGSLKKEYGPQDLRAVEIAGTCFLSLHGDFFRIVSEGELELLQKSSDASELPVYNGSEATFVKGAEGSVGDYFVYDKKTTALNLVRKKNLKDLAGAVFNGYTPSIALASSSHAEIPDLKKAIELYNTRMTK